MCANCGDAALAGGIERHRKRFPRKRPDASPELFGTHVLSACVGTRGPRKAQLGRDSAQQIHAQIPRDTRNSIGYHLEQHHERSSALLGRRRVSHQLRWRNWNSQITTVAATRSTLLSLPSFVSVFVSRIALPSLAPCHPFPGQPADEFSRRAKRKCTPPFPSSSPPPI